MRYFFIIIFSFVLHSSVFSQKDSWCTKFFINHELQSEKISFVESNMFDILSKNTKINRKFKIKSSIIDKSLIIKDSILVSKLIRFFSINSDLESNKKNLTFYLIGELNFLKENGVLILIETNIDKSPNTYKVKHNDKALYLILLDEHKNVKNTVLLAEKTFYKGGLSKRKSCLKSRMISSNKLILKYKDTNKYVARDLSRPYKIKRKKDIILLLNEDGIIQCKLNNDNSK